LTPGAGRPAASFCHVFTHDDRPCVYDVNSSRLFRIDQPLADVLPLYGPVTEEEIVARLGPRHGAEAIRRAVAEIRKARREEGLFTPERPRIQTTPPPGYRRADYESRLSHLILTVSEQCNQRCGYCLHGSSRSWVRPHRPRRMSEQTALAALQYFAERCGEAETPTVSFYGGEPLLEFGLIRTIVSAAGANPDWPDLRFVIDTNGTLIDREIAAFLVRRKFWLQISLDGGPGLHDRYRKTAAGEPSHALVMAGLRRILAEDAEAARRITFMVTLAPPYDLEAVAAYFHDFPPYRELGISRKPRVQINIADLEGVDLGPAGSRPRRDEHLRRNLAAARRRYVTACAAGRRDEISPGLTGFFDDPLITLYHRSRGPLPDRVAPTGCCLPGQRKLHVRADGAFQPCERVGESLLIGNVATGIDLDTVERLFADMYGAVRERCSDCWAVRLCEVCFSSIAPTWGEDGTAGCEVPPQLCERIRSRKEDVFRLYLSLLDRGPEAHAFLERTSLV